MRNTLSIVFFALFLSITSDFYAMPIEDKPVEEILKELRVSRIPGLIEILEEKSNQAHDANKLMEARDYLVKAILLKIELGMIETEGSAHLLTKVSMLEWKLGNQCQASQLSKRARIIYHQTGSNMANLHHAERIQNFNVVSCLDDIAWLKD